MKCITFILLFAGLHMGTASGQSGSVNRKKIIDMLLDQSCVKLNVSGENSLVNNYTISTGPSTSMAFRHVPPIPKYCLAKGAVICRLEEYVQLHSPFKLNIGVGGE